MEIVMFVAAVIFIVYALSKWIKSILNFSCFSVFPLDELEYLKKE